ncbi:MAG: hypothetical protein ACK58L_19075, partial [Planctomycetota bacterium]
VKSLERARAEGQSAKEIGQSIQRVSDQIRRLVAREFEPGVAAFQSISQATIDTIRSRTWPWFFFQD